MQINPLLMTDGYKTSHIRQYPNNTTKVYSNYTCRSVKYMPESAKDVVVFGTQYVFKYIQELFNEGFFKADKAAVTQEAKTYLSSYLNTDYDVSHFEALHDLGYLPIEVKGLDEGTVIPAGLPLFTITNTQPDFFWLTNFLETLISTLIWKPVHSASIAYGYRKILDKYAKETGVDPMFVNFQGHDFSFRGMQSPESAISSGLGFLTSFMGTDTLPTLQAAKHYYGDDNVGFSVPATEHSVMCSHGKAGEIDTLRYLMNKYPTGILSVVSDTWDLWKLITEYLPQLKEEILARDGKLVIRPDSGDPVDIICGLNVEIFESLSEAKNSFKDKLYDSQVHGEAEFTISEKLRLKVGNSLFELEADVDWNRYDKQYYFIESIDIKSTEIENKSSDKGVVELLWDIFGGTVNERGYKVLDSHIGAIYGDSITPERAIAIAERLKSKGFANQVVLGIGSYSLGYATRDSQGGAVKSTYVEVDGEGREIFKDPVTDDGTKKSAKGLLQVYEVQGFNTHTNKLEHNTYKFKDQCTWEEEGQGLLTPVFKDGQFLKTTTLTKIREKLWTSI